MIKDKYFVVTEYLWNVGPKLCLTNCVWSVGEIINDELFPPYNGSFWIVIVYVVYRVVWQIPRIGNVEDAARDATNAEKCLLNIFQCILVCGSYWRCISPRRRCISICPGMRIIIFQSMKWNQSYSRHTISKRDNEYQTSFCLPASSIFFPLNRIKWKRITKKLQV